jgi:hypothetical protein
MRNTASRRSGSIMHDEVDASEVQQAGVQRRQTAPRRRRPRAVERRDAGRLAAPALVVVNVVDCAVKSSLELAVHLSIAGT